MRRIADLQAQLDIAWCSSNVPVTRDPLFRVAHYRVADAIVTIACRERPVVMKGPMSRIVVVAFVLVMNVEGDDRPVAHAAKIGTAAPRSTDTPSSTGDEQAIPTPGSRTAPDRAGPVPPPDLQDFPTTTAPNKLATVALPNTFSDVTALFDRLPPEVAGHTRSPQFDRISPERSTVGYGEGRRMAGIGTALLRIVAIDVARGGFFPPNWTAGHVIAFLGRGKQGQDAGRDGELFWMRNETFEKTAGSAERLPIYGALWGRVDSPWIFSIHADDRESRDALLAAFVAAAKSSLREDVARRPTLRLIVVRAETCTGKPCGDSVLSPAV
jgi:hypothetical protein